MEAKHKRFKIYNINEIQKVYARHHACCGTVLYSEDGGITWQSVGMDTGKWKINDWVFAFIERKFWCPTNNIPE